MLRRELRRANYLIVLLEDDEHCMNKWSPAEVVTKNLIYRGEI